MTLVESRAGVKKRHIARDGETALDLAFEACKKLFIARKEVRDLIDGIIFCTQSEDHIMPPNSCILHKKLELSEDLFALDFNLACSGYIYGLALAEGLILSGRAKNILFVTADTYSKFINKKDRSARVLFGDGAAVSWITRSESEEGVLDILCATAGIHYDKFMIPAGGCRMPRSTETSISKTDSSDNVRTDEEIHMDGMAVLSFINSKVPGQIRKLLQRNGKTVEDVDLFVFHQASKMALDSLTTLLKISPDKVFRNLEGIGNTVSASIPIALQEARERKILPPGKTVLLSGFGVGLSWGSALMQT